VSAASGGAGGVSAALERVAGVVQRVAGISLGPAQYPSLEAALRRVDPELDADGFLRIDTERGPGAQLLERVIEEVTVNETFFFRQRAELDAIDWRVLVDTARASGRDLLRVWVAACASGEEAYTLAMLASEAFAPAPPSVSILATDISSEVLEQARRGQYGRRALKALDAGTRERYFRPTGAGVAVGEQLRDLVEFRRHNLVHDPVPGDGGETFDLIACRNVLIYFDADTVRRVIDLLERGLAPGGMLVLGAADRLCGSAHQMARPNDHPAELHVARRRSPERTLRRPLGRGQEAAPLDANAYFVRGLEELSEGDPDSAVGSLRRALYIDPGFGLAAFQLGRAQEERGDGAAAARAYEQALRTLDPDDDRHDPILDQVDIGDIAAACAMRLAALREAS